MSTEIFSTAVHIPGARRSTVDIEIERVDETMGSLDVERMTYEVKKALDSYDEEAVIKVVEAELKSLEERFDIKFNRFQITLANNKTREVEHTNDNDVHLFDGATNY